jgi:hypothetical protein
VPRFSDSFFDISSHTNDPDGIVNQPAAHTPTKINSSNLSRLLCFNARSLNDYKKKADITSWIRAIDPEIVCVNETWLNANIKSSEIFDISMYLQCTKE